MYRVCGQYAKERHLLWWPAGEGTWTSCTDKENTSMIVGNVFGWDQVTRLLGRGREKFTVLGRWVSPSSPIGVFGLRSYDPNTSVPSKCGSRVQTLPHRTCRAKPSATLWVASTLSSTLSTLKLEFLFAWTISANSTFKELVVCNNL